MKKTFPLVAGLIFAASPLLARTVALWPLNWVKSSSRVDGTCLIDAANKLGPWNEDYSQDTTPIGWTLPPNLDTGRRWRRRPSRSSAAYFPAPENSKYFACSTSVGRHVSVTKDFTLEGWFRMPALPASGQFYFIANGDGNNSAANSHRWFLTLRRNSPANSGVTWQIYSQRHNTGDAVLATLNASQIDSLTNGWHHWAISLEQRTSDVVWRFYQDGTLLGSKVAAKCGAIDRECGLFALGGRNATDRVFNGSFSFCRLSDTVLAPEEFLNAPVDRHETVGLWKLDRDAHGGINGAPSVGDVHLTGGYPAFHPWNVADRFYSIGIFYPDADCAFTNNPPNPTVSLPNGNAGSLFGRRFFRDSRLVIHNIGSELSLTNDFTVEGWLKLECRDSVYEADSGTWLRHICGTRADKIGWVLQLRRRSGLCEAVILAQDEAGVVIPETNLGDLSACEGNWAHVALAYSHASGDGATGVWNCYLDGMLTGSATNSIAPRDGGVDTNSLRLIFGPQKSAEEFSLPAKLDCWRASRTALQPAQFLCATNGTAATDVLALWPMNVQDGAYIDGTDVAGGNYTFEDPLDAMYRAASGDGAPEIPGLSTATNGCAEFRSANGSDRSRSYLICYDHDTVGTLSSTNGCTFEVYLYPTYQPSGNDYEFIYLMNSGTLNALGSTILGGTACANLTYRANGFVIFVNGCLKDEQFRDTDGQPILLPLNTWSHVALTLHAEGSTCIFDLYVDGVKRGTLTSSSGTPRLATDLFLGGRYASANSFRGKMSLLRISRGVLSTNEFLCARSSVPESRAYWPLDGEPALDLTGRINGTDGMNDFAVASGVTALAGGARARVPWPDTSTNFTGDASANAGAVQMSAGGYAQTSLAGTYVDLDDSFTVEGWVRWARSQGAAAEVVCGTYEDGKGGWKLILDSTGAVPMLRLHAEGQLPVSMLADGVLMADASSLEGEWRHLALRYDTTVGDGVWSLLVDGVAAGSVTNIWRPSGVLDRATFRLGAFGGDTSFSGGYDMWRISRGVRGVDDILWKMPGGTTVFLR